MRQFIARMAGSVCAWQVQAQVQVQVLVLVSVGITLGLIPGIARGQILITNASAGTVGEYSTSGATINANLISGLQNPYGITVAGGFIYVSNNTSSGTIGKYTLAGVPVNTALVTGLHSPSGIVVSGDKIFVSSLSVSNLSNGVIGEYGTDGSTVNASLISGLGPFGPTELALSGTNLYAVNGSNLSKFSTSGDTINASLVHYAAGSGPEGLAVAGGNVFQVYSGLGTVAEYDGTTGAVVNSSLISGLGNPFALAESGGKLYISSGSTGAWVYTDAGALVSSLSNLPNSPAIAVLPEPAGLIAVGISLLASHVRRRESRRFGSIR